ncbi:type II toxin-antitoxin system VapC family toxin [Pararhizobium antarcticum]|uniref:PIN domain-containing protein n=1 Tax=Pararhizobium antarcticum TaxID=1798805 RepID=A0A657LYY4_9HYPH|nr:type II toxin-antitoxin system VapC family toxin [Pararhizobium antarcticum]OJF94464.1 hypothetical protein AX761_18355 [Rhizobium sp. 58]OJG00722.1 hypothetical protein AX760_09625 [Pararhizobium antarcticum]
MFIDSSAVVEYLLRLPQSEKVADHLRSADTGFVSAPTVMFEAVSVLSSRLNCTVPEALALVQSFFSELDAEIMPITPDIGLTAIDAFARYGKGQHPAKLNFGDCFTYAACKAANVPLLFVGDEFSKTDLG